MNLIYTLKLDENLNLEDPHKTMALTTISIYYTWKTIKSACNNNKLKISAPTRNGKLYFPNGSKSDIQDYFHCIIKKYKPIANNLPVQIYLNKIKNKIIFKIKAGYKLEPLSPETMKLLGSKKKIFIKKKMG